MLKKTISVFVVSHDPRECHKCDDFRLHSISPGQLIHDRCSASLGQACLFLHSQCCVGRTHDQMKFHLPTIDPVPSPLVTDPVNILLLVKGHGCILLRHEMLGIELHTVVSVLQEREVSENRHLVLQIGHS